MNDLERTLDLEGVSEKMKDLEKTRISSMKIIIKLSMKSYKSRLPMRTATAGAFVNPKGMTSHSKLPYLVVMAVFSTFSVTGTD